ncbi:DUF6177 family protein [Streptomyces sp. NPDC001135]
MDVLTDADVLTDKSVIVIYDRPVVAATTWLTEAVRTVARGRRELYLVTSPNTRLSLPTRTVLERIPARWVVRHPENGYYDGLSGAVLRWHDGRFSPATDNGPRIADAFQPPLGKGGERQLLPSIRTIHPAQEHLILGGALEDAWQTLTGLPPAGRATAEPVNVPWSPGQLTDLARSRARQSQSTRAVAVGTADRPAIAALRIAHTQGGVKEHIALALGYAADERAPIELLPQSIAVTWVPPSARACTPTWSRVQDAFAEFRLGRRSTRGSPQSGTATSASSSVMPSRIGATPRGGSITRSIASSSRVSGRGVSTPPRRRAEH